MTSAAPHRGVSLGAGLAALLVAECLVAVAVLALRQPEGVPSEARLKVVTGVGVIILAAAGSGWWLSQASGRLSASRPAVAVAGGLAASLIRLAVPLLLLGWLQTADAMATLPAPLRTFLTETLVTSYLVLLLVDILLHIAGTRRLRPNRPAVSDR